MKNHIITFNRDTPGVAWGAKDEDLGISLCSCEFEEYVDVPREVLEFDAVFTVREPVGKDHFKLIGHSARTGNAALDTRESVGFTGGATALISQMHEAGYRYLKVLY